MLKPKNIARRSATVAKRAGTIDKRGEQFVTRVNKIADHPQSVSKTVQAVRVDKPKSKDRATYTASKKPGVLLRK